MAGTGPLLEGIKGCRVAGYEIHMGKTKLEAGVYPAFIITESSGRKAHSPDGAVSRDGLVFHGLALFLRSGFLFLGMSRTHTDKHISEYNHCCFKYLHVSCSLSNTWSLR